MDSFDLEKGKMEDTSYINVRPVNPRLMRTVPSNIAKVIGNFEDMQRQTCAIKTS